MLRIAVSLLLTVAFARTHDRILAVKLEVQHNYKCTACAEKMAGILKGQEGVRGVRTVADSDATVVFFESGRADLDAMRAELKRRGFNATVTWGPAAIKLDGHYEETPLNELPFKRPTLKELKDKRKAN